MFHRAICWTVLASVVLVINTGSAHAVDEIGLSLDGRTWTSELRRPLFEPGMRWVPGDSETRSLWVRNQGPTGASMRLAVRSADLDGLLERDDILISARVRGGSWIPLNSGGAGRTLTEGALAQGDRLRLDVRVAFVAAATNGSEVDKLPLDFVVRLTQDGHGSVGGVEGGSDPGGSGDLPATGAAVEPWLLWLAAGLIGSGLALLVARRREEEKTRG